ncbi:hypothetical protein SAMN05216302_101961 [Nitrosomonas aestuarii]|uniref:Tc toxin complex TcA C-terminal TcB-binding domain-containing protein n=1 Tax=Nitrosomonas aestuarii TaxID=52441 RepID=A0A1I4DAW4_9PROT|nr:hypothetical protein [Nitrosomonas aestuarii]SFK89266.1 hypothetical protein SAMN05216302_101961 [Nitrosomonas aestuarii]
MSHQPPAGQSIRNFHGNGNDKVKKETVRERQLNYRFYLHQHPYVQQLMQRLLTEGTEELQAVDTKYKTDGTSLPGSIKIEVNSSTNLLIPANSRITLLESIQATSGGVSIELTAGMEAKLTNAVRATAPDGLKMTLVDGIKLPSVDTKFIPPVGSKAIVSNHTKVILNAATQQLTLYNGMQVTVPLGTQVILASGTLFTLPANTEATLLSSRPCPVLFSDFFDAAYRANTTLVQRPYPVKDLDFTSSGAYAIYNWELFFHVPITIAIHLSKNQRFAEAQRWFHYIFDPTDDSDGLTPERFWKVRPFHTTDVRKIEEILVNLVTNDDPDLRNETIYSIGAWKDAPFRPHVIARYRQSPYMFKTVMAYLDNLIAWGDSLFRQDTGEAIDEALQLYVLAANILGPRPLPVPKKGNIRSQTYDNLRRDLSKFGTVIRDMEADIPFDLGPFPSSDLKSSNQLMALRSLGKALYFCVPRNDKLLGYWDTVADRLFKIRNSLNFQGVFRQLALFEPPIDPAMLARAAAAGLDVAAIVNGINQPLPLVRFQLLVQKAAEIVQEVKSLGSNLLSAMEKEDGEAMAILRARHERVVMEMVEHVKFSQLQEAIKSKEGLLKSLALAVQRYTFNERQLGKSPDEIENAIPGLDELDKDSLVRMNFTVEEPSLALREVEVDIARDLGESGGKIMSNYEQDEFLRLEKAQKLQEEGANLNMIAKFLSIIPELGAQAQPMGVGAALQFGGRALSTQLSLAADASARSAGRNAYEANRAARIGSYARREQDWAFQSNLAAGEITQIFKQLRAAEIREAIAELELRNHRQQMQHAEEIEHFLNEEGTDKSGKRTNKALYTWMKREVKGLYSQCFQFAFDIAKKAERALQHELGNPGLSYLQYGYLAGKEGLLAGEKLYMDVKRMEMAYHDLNQREYELTKHISLLQLDPLALIQLRMTGRCMVRLPEAMFDMDGPGHYFRRIKTVAVSIPCVTGPYASVNCTLTLLKSSIRKTQTLRGAVYDREGAEDDRFSDNFGSLQSIVTSSAQNDSGLFETNLRDERYLPFENSGVISEWQLQLPADPSKHDLTQFDYDTISDVIFHIRYTAREGGSLLRKGAQEHAKELIKSAQLVGSVRLFSIRHEFPTEWAAFQNQPMVQNQRYALALKFREEHYPSWSQERLNNVLRIDLLVRSSETSLEVADKAEATDVSVKKVSLNKDRALGDLFVGNFNNLNLPEKPIGEFKLYFDSKLITDLWIAVTWNE